MAALICMSYVYQARTGIKGCLRQFDGQGAQLILQMMLM